MKKRWIITAILLFTSMFCYAQTIDTSILYGSWQGDKNLGTIEILEDGTGVVTLSHNPEVTMTVKITKEEDHYIIEQSEANNYEFYTGVFPIEVAQNLVDMVRPWSWDFILSPDNLFLEGTKYSSYQEYDVNTGRINYVDNEFQRPAVWTRLDGRVQAPEFSLESGEYETAQVLRIDTQTPAAEIYYTTDETPPLPENAIKYTRPLRLETNTVFKAIAVREGWENSPVIEKQYLFNRFEVKTVITNPFQIDLTGYAVEGNKIVFNLMVTNLSTKDTSMRIYANDTLIIDETGAEYGDPDLSLGRNWSNIYVQNNLIPGIPIEASIEIPVTEMRGHSIRVLNIALSSDSVRFFNLPLN